MLNLLEDCLERKGNAVGTFLGVTTPAIMEAIASSGLDFVVIDTEHGPYGTESMNDLISTASLLGISPLVRIADLTHGEMQHALDNGADGVIIPCLREVDEFRKAVDLGKFPPLGNSTRSPSLIPVTPEPTLATRATPSEPTGAGSFGFTP